MELTPFHWLFIFEYMKDYNNTEAVRRAGYEGKHARQEGWRLSQMPMIKSEIKRQQEQRLSKISLDADDVWRDVRAVLNSDPRNIVEHRRGACRYCHGADHEYQFRPQEMRDARVKFAESDYGKAGLLFDEQGGLGYDSRKEPHPDCPECEGQGIEVLVAHDTRLLSKEEAALYDGIEPTKHGTKFKMRSRDAARDLAARVLGMNKSEIVLTPGKAKEMTDDELAVIAAIGAGK
jgi:phage terminase small subunit